MAVLCEDEEGEWCMSLWQRDELFPDRYRVIGGRVRVEPGMDGLMLWNFGDQENGVVVVSGVELPENAYEYEWQNGGTTYRRGVSSDHILGVFLVHDVPVPKERSPFVHLLDEQGNSILR